jgi:VWFA-related protein
MCVCSRLSIFVLASALCAAGSYGQQNIPANAGGERIQLDVVVTPKSGPAVPGLSEQDFTLLDNKVERPISAFRAVNGRQEPVEAILVIDAVNTGFDTVAYERGEIDKFLRMDGGHLAHPLALAVFTDSGVQIQEGFSDDGNVVSDALNKYVIGLRTLRRSAGFYGASDRLQMSMNALQSIATREAKRPGRKLILWVSPGWPLLSGPEVLLDRKEEEQVFDTVVTVSTGLRKARITVYAIDPLGTQESVGRDFLYETYLKGVKEPSQTNLGDLALQVLAVQSGGSAFQGNNDVKGMLEKAFADADAYYELSFDPPLDAKKNEYHQLEVKVDRKGTTARTRTGYYAMPDVKESAKVPPVTPAH